MSTPVTYVEYFRDIAVRHKAILHNPLSETPDGPPGEARFFLFDMDEIAKGARSKIGDGHILFLHQYEWVFTDNEAGDVRRELKAGFMVVKKAAATVVARAAVMASAEAIILDITRQMRADTRQGSSSTPFGIVDWNKTQVAPVSNAFGEYHGWWFEFPFTHRLPDIDDASLLPNVFNPRP